MDNQKIRDTILMLAEGLVKAGDESRRLQASLFCLQSILAAVVNPANPAEGLKEIQERDRLAQSLAPAPQSDKFQTMIQALKSGAWGIA